MAKKNQEENVTTAAQELAAATETVVAETVVAKTEPAKLPVKRGMLFSRLDHAEKVIYKGQEAMISPRAKMEIDINQLDQTSLPRGIQVRPL